MPISKTSGSTTTAIVLPIETLELVKRAAMCRALTSQATRVSASDVIRDALAAYESTLRAEVEPFDGVFPITLDRMG